MNSINLTSPVGFTSAVLIADKTNNDNIAQMTIVGGETVSAALEIQSVLGGLLIPRMTTAQRTATGFVPTDGMIVYDSTLTDFFYYRNGSWNVSSGSGTVTSITAGANLTGGTITTTGTIALATALTGITSIASGSSLVLKTNVGTTALTLDTSQNASFAEAVGVTGRLDVFGLINIHNNSGLFLNNAGNTFFTALVAGGITTSTTYTLPQAYPTITGQGLTSTTGGAMSWTNVALNGGNTLGAALTLGTTDSNSLILETNSITALTLDTSQNASFAGTVTVNTGLVGLANTCSFMANVSATQNNVTGDGTVYTVIFDTVDGQLGTNYNHTTGVFTAPRTGYYFLSFQVTLTNIGVAHTNCALHLTISSPSNVTQDNLNPVPIISNGSIAFNIANTYFMNSGATAICTVEVDNGAKTVNVYGQAGGGTYFTGFQVA